MDEPDTTIDHPLRAICERWLRKITAAIDHKRALFQDDADEAMKFFDGEQNWMFRDDYARKKKGGFLVDINADADDGAAMGYPSFQMSVNKVAELVDLFGPSMYHQNPEITVSAHDPPFIAPEMLGITIAPEVQQGLVPPEMAMMDPMVQQYQMIVQQQQQDQGTNALRAELLQYLLTRLQEENDKKTEGRRAINEALIKGMGLLWTELVKSPSGETSTISSIWRTVDDLVMDPDAQCWEDVQWVAVKCVRPYWEVEDERGYSRDTLRKYATTKSSDQQAEESHQEHYTEGKTNDLLCYWKLYSKMGIGDKLRDIGNDWRGEFGEFGQFCYLELCHGCPYALNMKPELWDLDMEPVLDETTGEVSIDPATGEPELQLPAPLFLSAQWPIPFWIDGGWPFVPLTFHEKPGQVWPISHIKSGIGELRFINWAMSFLAVKVGRACETTVAIMKSAGEDLKKQLCAGGDYKCVEIEADLGKRIDEVVSFLVHPQFNPEIWNVLNAVIVQFEKRTGLTELIYGMSGRQMRSATEANVLQQNVSIRPADMANQVEDFLSLVAAREAMAARWLLEPKDVQPILGPIGAMAWQQWVASTELDGVAKEFKYRVAAGTARRPNKETKIQQLNEAIQVLGPAVQQYMGMTGDVSQMNALVGAWAKANDVDMPPFMPPPPPMPMPPPEEQPPAQAA